MRNLYIEETTGAFLTPEVKLNADTGSCSLQGESFIENPREFYQPIIEWIDTYMKEVKGNMCWDLKFLYLNSSSSKIMSSIFRKLKEYEDQGARIEVNWYYPDDNTDLLEEGEYFKAASRLQFKMIPYPFED